MITLYLPLIFDTIEEVLNYCFEKEVHYNIIYFKSLFKKLDLKDQTKLINILEEEFGKHINYSDFIEKTFNEFKYQKIMSIMLEKKI